MRLSLFWKLGIIYPALFALVLFAVDTYAVEALRRDYVRSGFEHLTALKSLVEGQPPDVANPAALREWTAWMARSGARVTVIAFDGRVLTDSSEDPARMENHGGRPEVQDALARGEGRAIRYSNTLKRDLLYLATRHLPAPESSTGPAVIRLALPLAQIDEDLAHFRRRMWTASFVILLLAGSVSLFISRTLAKRIVRLKHFSERVAQGDFRPLPVEQQGDELTDLGRTLNETAAQLDQTIHSLTEERNRSSAILGSMVEGVAVISPDGRIVFLNQTFCRDLAVDADNCEGRPLVEVIRQSDLLAVIQRVLAGGESTRGEVSLAVPGAAGSRDFAATAAPVRADGTTGAVLVLHDISELRRLERVRRDFVANVSHEFKTPLTAIQGFAETLLAGALDDTTNRRRFVEIIRDHSARLARLTDDLLKLSLIEAGKLELEFRPVNVTELIESCAETTRFKAAQKQLSLSVECLAGVSQVRGDARRLAEVLQNILDNAVQYTPAGGRISITAGAEERFVRIAVADTGIGIPRDEQQRIFERFYRVDAARSREAGGTGLGLSIAKHLVEAHGGRIEVESEVSHGSTFSIFLPAT
ncbi:MAG: PAS domain-containing protein [Acidobacteria bacterium]|nr:PAS domain-containing protein [Acidobacteriota bacterium]MBI3662653.1 PAS domain-containing protein [Acidobacteriota bacterium]